MRLLQDQASLRTGPAAEFHESGAIGDETGKLWRDTGEKGRLRSGDIVFRQLANGLEQPRAFGVVEVLAGQGLPRSRKASEHVLAKAPADGRGVVPRWLGRCHRSHSGPLTICREPETRELPACLRRKEI